MEHWAEETALLDADVPGHKAGLPGWDVLRFLGGEIAEVMALAQDEELSADQPVLVTGRFERGGLFRAAFLPRQAHDRFRLTANTAQGPAELLFPEGWPGPARLTFNDGTGGEQTESWDAWNPWPPLVEAIEVALGKKAPSAAKGVRGESIARDVAEHAIRQAALAQAVAASPAVPTTPAATNQAITATRGHPVIRSSGHPIMHCPTWQDAIRCLELDDAVRRSVARRRASTLDYQEATEEASFKGAMTLVGCAMLWISLMLLILSVWVPWLGWVIAPVFAIFLVMQAFRWVVPSTPNAENPVRNKTE
jgi:hypothetical protein